MTRTQIPVTRGNAGDDGDNIDLDLTSDSKKVQAIGLRRSDDNKVLSTIDADGVLVNLGANNDIVSTPPAALTTGQVAPTNTAATVVIARATRRNVNIRNVGSVTVYLGPATVTTANGYRLLAGEDKDFTTAALIQGITASGTGALHYADEY